MKVISNALKTHLQQASTSLATLWKVKRQDGVILGFTDHDQNITYDASDGDGLITYFAAEGFTPSANETGSSLGTDNLEVTSFLEVSAITDIDLRAGVYDFCVIEIRLVNYNDLTMGDLKLRTGSVGNVKSQNGMGHFEIRGLLFRLSTAIGQLWGPTCRAELGDSKCQVDLSLFIQNGTVNTVADRQTFNPVAGLVMRGSATPLSPAPAGWFSNGIISWTSGANNGFKMECKTWDGTTVSLFESMPFAISPGDTFTIEPGCDLTKNDCQNKFNNIANLRAEPKIPGMDQILIYPNASGSVPT